MLELRDMNANEFIERYNSNVDKCIELCFANIEDLLNIAYKDSDERIRQLGGEEGLLDLMNGYLNLAYRLQNWKSNQFEE